MLASSAMGGACPRSIGAADPKITAANNAFISPHVTAQKIVSNFAMSSSWLRCVPFIQQESCQSGRCAVFRQFRGKTRYLAFACERELSENEHLA